MRAWRSALMAALVAMMISGLAGAAWALSADEVVKLKQAGVSDATIQKMLEQERQTGAGSSGGFSGGLTDLDRLQDERLRQEKSLEMKTLPGDQQLIGAPQK